MAKKDLMDAIKKAIPSLIACVIAQEKHKDGTTHLHAFIKRSSNENMTGKELDALSGKRGNYQRPKSEYNWVKYITKEDEDPDVYGMDLTTFLEAAEKKKSTAFAFVAQRVMDGARTRDILAENPGFVLQHKRKLEEFIPFVDLERTKKAKLDWEENAMPALRESMFDEKLSTSERNISRWLVNNIRNPKRKLRTQNLWIFSEATGMGKTSLVVHLQKYLQIYYMPKEEVFYDGWEDGQYDLIVMDEFKGQKKLTELNEWAGGASMPIRKKGAQGMKHENTPMLILSNYSPANVYKKASQHEGIWSTFLARWLVCELDSPCNVLYPEEQQDEEEEELWFGYE